MGASEPLIRPLVVIAALLAGIAVVLGAFGAHALQERLTEQALATWHTGVQYHFIHALALLLVAALWAHLANGWAAASAVAFVIGILLFSGSLYALALGAPRILGAIAPLGGTAFILGWAGLAIAAWRG
ncbi:MULTISPECIES: DUF423 domain-containing protein [Thioalkalivibrio]|uniref:DUF423 domain-containing protein n=1 Tax=Thioalkalivibrio TaxID=106633 RepID=UPI0003612FF3|nr:MULTISPECIES: DUF423 domain-containing protein [Thioalkalivibrio]OOC48789.1 DUF423 domain-containing protein [Thioalkalivibrio versutus]